MANINLCVAVLIGGVVGYTLKIPSGALEGGMLGGLFAKSFMGLETLRLPYLSFCSQLLVAFVIVAQADVASVRQIPRFIPVAIIYSLVILVFSVFMACFVSKLCKMDLMTAVFSMAPGGLSGLGLAAVESGANASLALVFHVIRVSIVLIAIPFIALLLEKMS